MVEKQSAKYTRFGGEDGVEVLEATYRNHSFAPHWHPAYTVGFFDDGEAELTINGREQKLKSGDIMVIGPNVVHAGRSASEQGYHRYFGAYIEPDTLEKLGILSHANDHLKAPAYFIRDHQWAKDFRYMLRHQKSEKVENFVIQPLIMDLFETLFTSARYQQDMSYKDNVRASMREISAYLEENYDEQISLQELAEMAELSPYHFLRVFRDTIGLSPHAYQLQVRVENAKKLLRDGMSGTEVAYMAGFADQSHFIRTFKRRVGVTPSQFAMV